MRELTNCPLETDSNDYANMAKYIEVQARHGEKAKDKLSRKNERTALRVAEAKGDLAGVDTAATFLEYGRSYQHDASNVEKNVVDPPWAKHILGWSGLAKCAECHLHFRVVGEVLCRVCAAKVKVVPAKEGSFVERSRVLHSYLGHIFGYSSFKESQLVALMCESGNIKIILLVPLLTLPSQFLQIQSLYASQLVPENL